MGRNFVLNNDIICKINSQKVRFKKKIALCFTESPDSGNRSRRSSGSDKMRELEEINGVVCGKNVVITGGASGLGYAFLNRFLHYGANVSTKHYTFSKLRKINV